MKFSGVSLQDIFAGVFRRFEKGELYPKGVERNFEKLPTVLKVIASPVGTPVVDSRGKVHYGSGGDWPNAEGR
jgi:hypothetical protein